MEVTFEEVESEDDELPGKGVEKKYLNTFLKVKYVKVDAKALQATTPLQKIFRRRNQENSQYYLTSSRKEIKNARNVFEERTPFWKPEIHEDEAFKAYAKSKTKESRVRDRKLRFFERDTAKSRQNKDIRARLHLPDPPDDVHTIVDIDPEFFSLVEGRPIPYEFNKTDYINDINQTTILKMQAGFREDEILRIEENFADEQAKYLEICTRYNDYVDSFEVFLSEDYDKSIALLKQSDEVHAELQNKIDEFNSISVDLGIKRRKVYVLEEKYRHTKMYQDFLYRISPRAWCKKNNIVQEKIVKFTDTEDSHQNSKPSDMFAEYQLESKDGTIPSLSHLIKNFEEDKKHVREPKLYFDNPKQLVKIFRGIIVQNLKGWMHSEKLVMSLGKLKTNVFEMKEKINKEFREIEETIEDLNNKIEIEERRCQSFKDQVNKIINTYFYEAVASEYAVKLYVSVQDVYEKLIVSTVSFSTYEMLRSLQAEYEATMAQMDSLDPQSVNEVRKETFAKDKRAMKLAHEAAVTLQNLEKVHRRLRKDFEPPFKRTTKPIMFSTVKTKKRNIPNKKILTDIKTSTDIK